MKWLLLALVGGCGSAGTPSSSCTQVVCPAGGQRYQFCSSGGSCRYLAADNSSFSCKSCSDCMLASAQISDWCAGRAPGPGGGTQTTSCDVARQDCISGLKCVGFFDGQALVGKCIADGDRGLGQPCSPTDSPDTLLDNCHAGLVCDNLFGNFERVCRPICAADADCPTGERCGDFLFAGVGWGWCAKPCTPFSSLDCPSGMDCSETVDILQQPPSGEAGFFLCKHTGRGEAYDPCFSDADCGAETWCGVVDQQDKSARCLPICDDFTDCPPPPTITGLTASCHHLIGPPDNAGYCLAN